MIVKLETKMEEGGIGWVFNWFFRWWVFGFSWAYCDQKWKLL